MDNLHENRLRFTKVKTQRNPYIDEYDFLQIRRLHTYTSNLAHGNMLSCQNVNRLTITKVSQIQPVSPNFTQV